jgi:hypothetical protein
LQRRRSRLCCIFFLCIFSIFLPSFSLLPFLYFFSLYFFLLSNREVEAGGSGCARRRSVRVEAHGHGSRRTLGLHGDGDEEASSRLWW